MKKNRERHMDGDICALCNSQRRLFEPTVLHCNGTCGMQKIRRNSYYYTAGSKSNSNHWCVNCHGLLKDEETIMLDDGTEVWKKDLQKVKNDSMPEEAWVQCDKCDSWVHQICALFNGRKNKSASSFSCPKCDLAKLSAPGLKLASKPLKAAKDLPHCKMSLAIEKGLEKHLGKAYMLRAKNKGLTLQKVEKVEGVTVRVVSNMEKKHVVRDEMFARYSKSGCSSEFPVRSKCIALFQKIHGVDVILFGMYVFEYGHNCPAPNRRRVYISYLDSAQYFEPKCYRTIAYHALIVEYLRYVKQRGFHTAHFWSCPPLPGDDYIFYCHPLRQMIPRDDMLRNWYHQMLEKAKMEGIVLDVKTLHEEYFKNDGSGSILGEAPDPTCLPYFEGDYIPGEIEKIIRDISAENEAKSKNREDMPSLSTSKKGGSKKGTRSNPGELVNLGRDKVMLRLANAMANMKDNFMVVHLRSRAFAAAVERGEDVSCWSEPDDYFGSNKKTRMSGKNSGLLLGILPSNEEKVREMQILQKGDPIYQSQRCSDDMRTKLSNDDRNSIVLVDGSLRDRSGGSGNGIDGDPLHAFRDGSSQKVPFSKSLDPITFDDFEPEPLEDQHVRQSGGGQQITTGKIVNGSLSKSNEIVKDKLSKENNIYQQISKRGIDGIQLGNARRLPNRDTVDEDEPQENEMFESRQQFLTYCQANHFQFDDLRRAKHTTMMVLFQLHNPNAPMFIQTCGVCYCEITHGTRYHCNDCSNYDLCENCYEPIITNKWANRGLKFMHDNNHRFAPIDAEADSDVQKSREERSRRIKAHLELLSHAASCSGPPSCNLNNCARMKELFDHVRTCNVNPKKNCKICSRILTLLTVHARMCSVRNDSCPLPYCDRIREKMRRRRQQQQLMDDRRRQAQNQLYRERLQQD